MSTSAFGVEHGIDDLEELEKGLAEAAAAVRRGAQGVKQGARDVRQGVRDVRHPDPGLRVLPHSKLISGATKKITPVSPDPGYYISAAGNAPRMVLTTRATKARMVGRRIGDKLQDREMQRLGKPEGPFRRAFREARNAHRDAFNADMTRRMNSALRRPPDGDQ